MKYLLQAGKTKLVGQVCILSITTHKEFMSREKFNNTKFNLPDPNDPVITTLMTLLGVPVVPPDAVKQVEGETDDGNGTETPGDANLDPGRLV